MANVKHSRLVIVESPAKAKTIRKFLGTKYSVKASMGHIRDLPKSQLGIDIDNDFDPKYITIRGKGDIIKDLKTEAKNAKEVFLATDPDREGEAISWHLTCLLNIDPTKNCRITFNEITKNAVKNAIEHPRPISMNLVDAQQARRGLDRLVGYKLSPLLWKKVRGGLSAGRVQSVAVRLICDREEEIEKFNPEEYWSLTAKLMQIDTKLAFEAKFHGDGKGKIDLVRQEQAEEIVNALEKAKFIVDKIKKAEKKRFAAPPFTTSTLQQDASRKLGFAIKKTMMVAQQLYEGVEIKGHGAVGLITYIRTDSVRVSAEAQNEARGYIDKTYGLKFLPIIPRIYKNKSSSQDAHEAIRPSYVDLAPQQVKDSLTNDQYKLYKLIWERFISSQMEAAVYDTVTVDIFASSYIFKASGSQVKFQGFMVLYTEGKDKGNQADDESLVELPELMKGEEVKLKKLTPKQHFTQPPPRYTEASLVKTLEEKGIGRPSTYAPIITTIILRGYVEKEQKAFMPTEIGKVVTDIMKDHFESVVDVEFTANMEQQLDQIEEGQKDRVEVMKDFYSHFVSLLKDAEVNIKDVHIEDEVSDIKCEKCGRNMVIKTGRFGKFLACPGFPECRNTKPLLKEAGVKCPMCGGRVLLKKSKKNKVYLGCEYNPKCPFMAWGEPANEDCPECGSFLIKSKYKKTIQIKCSNENCKFVKDSK